MDLDALRPRQPHPPARARGRLAALLLLGGALVAVVALLLAATGRGQQTTSAAQDLAVVGDLAAARGQAQVAQGQETALARQVAAQRTQLSVQADRLRCSDSNLQKLQSQLGDLQDRLARLDQHNAEIRGALGLTGADGVYPAPATPPPATRTPGPSSGRPGGEGGETGPLLSLAADSVSLLPGAGAPGDPADSLRRQIAEISHRLDIYSQIEANLAAVAVDQRATLEQAGEDSDTAPPADPGADPTALPPPVAGTGGGPAPPPKTPSPPLVPPVSHLPHGLPYAGEISSPFGWRLSPFVKGKLGFHKGIDIVALLGTAVHATQAGRVLIAGWSDVYGRMVQIDHGSGWVTLYGHNSRLIVQAGATVTAGQIIAYSGSTGMSTGPHIHYEVRHHDIPVDPLKSR